MILDRLTLAETLRAENGGERFACACGARYCSVRAASLCCEPTFDTAPELSREDHGRTAP